MSTSVSDKVPHLNIRIKANQRNIIEQAAQVRDKTVSDFVRDAALFEAKNALLDRTVLVLDKKEWDQFIAALDEPPQDNKRLQNLFSRKSAWEK